ncbi:hypothetical protein K461DRAFT_82762 [Myriangium duriaei CBS 260.36]|uniref:ER membrane protein complex subunit 7 beta-sandwich domain-containing protein n=1 Tax=Myriangium duriaei CBS 260.36 TaxID=1168546 RepID=A0A9P4JBL9_9PEZI|nr:hypothetical protein K461DRAFT_82762 [Myriangium duriaei CBS 260.36]
MQLSTLLLPLLALLTPTLAAELTLTIPSTSLLPNPNLLPPTTHATLLCPSGVLTARLSRQNTLHFPSVPAGSHLLSVYTRDYTFPPHRIDVSPSTPAHINAVQTFRGHEWGNLGPAAGNSSTGSLTLPVRPLARRDFYQRREGFSVLSVFKNPMILMALFSGALIFGMPYLMENMDEETRAEFEEAQKKGPLAGMTGGGDTANAIQNFDFASWMAGKSTSTGTESPKAAAGGSTGAAKSLR